MPKRAKELSDKALASAVAKAIKSLQEEGVSSKAKYIPAGGVPCLHVQVRMTGQSWIARYTAGKKEDGTPWRRDFGLGSYREVGLAEARDRTRELLKQLRDGVDPLDLKRAQDVRTRKRGMTFNDAAKRVIAAKSPEWKNAKHADQWRNTLDTYAGPIIGNMPVDAIELQHVEAVLAPIWETKNETAVRVRSRIEAVLDWATVGNLRSGDNPARWKGNLVHRLGKPSKVKKKRNHPALPVDDMPRFITQLRKRSGAARALDFTILTATRSGETRGATWGEIDMKRAIWTIPAERMKAEKEHVVPLSPQALALLKALPRMAGTDLVFPAADGGELSDATMAKVIKAMDAADPAGFKDPKQGNRVVVPHGFRSTFRDWAEERTNYPRSVAEMALAHTIGNKVEAAYRRGDLLPKRAKMMADWADFIETMPRTGNVSTLRRKA